MKKAPIRTPRGELAMVWGQLTTDDHAPARLALFMLILPLTARASERACARLDPCCGCGKNSHDARIIGHHATATAIFHQKPSGPF
jgi:hypothetical protein